MPTPFVIADFCEDLRCQVNLQLADRGVAVPAGLNAERTLHFYLNLELRTLRPRPRKINWSDTVLGKRLLPVQSSVVKEIAAKSAAGDDLNPFLSDKLKTKPGYHDRMLNDWGIFHLHLGGIKVEPDGFTTRSNALLYVYPQPDALYLLDVLEHGESFGDIHLVEIIHRNWPDIVAQYKMNLRLSLEPRSSASAIVEARRRGLQPLIPLSDGTIYMPFGGGVSTCGLNSRIVRQTDSLLELARNLQHFCHQEAEQIRAGIEAQTGRHLEQLHLKVMWVEADLLIVESQVNIGILRPGQLPPRMA
ncbi:MAG: hypothetical protein U1A78_33390 [Polyangia bacterium]